MAELRLERSGSPTGIVRFLYRLPIPLFRARLGFLFGRRFIMLEHIGRKSGATRRTVLEVVASHPGVIYVAAAWGSKSRWLRNVKANPGVNFYLGSRRFEAVAETVSKGTAISIMEEYGAAHPRTLERLAAFMLDEPGETTEERARRIGETVPLVRLSLTH